MEISTKGLRRINDFFPASWVLDASAERDVAMIISDDAHNVSELGSQFDLAEQALEKHHITHRLKF
jgi:histidinol phosphatase-like PHP family hydrolase